MKDIKMTKSNHCLVTDDRSKPVSVCGCARYTPSRRIRSRGRGLIAWCDDDGDQTCSDHTATRVTRPRMHENNCYFWAFWPTLWVGITCSHRPTQLSLTPMYQWSITSGRPVWSHLHRAELQLEYYTMAGTRLISVRASPLQFFGEYSWRGWLSQFPDDSITADIKSTPVVLRLVRIAVISSLLPPIQHVLGACRYAAYASVDMGTEATRQVTVTVSIYIKRVTCHTYTSAGMRYWCSVMRTSCRRHWIVAEHRASRWSRVNKQPTD